MKLQQKSYTSDELGLNSRWQVVFRDPAASFARAQAKSWFLNELRAEEYSGRQKEKTGPQSFHHWQPTASARKWSWTHFYRLSYTTQKQIVYHKLGHSTFKANSKTFKKILKMHSQKYFNLKHFLFKLSFSWISRAKESSTINPIFIRYSD